MIRTCGPRFRKPVLYPTELRGLKGVLKIITQTTGKCVWFRGLLQKLKGSVDGSFRRIRLCNTFDVPRVNADDHMV